MSKLATSVRANAIQLFGAITKVDDEQRIVSGYASTTSLDTQNESITKAAMEDALPEYMKYANVREMHGNSAVGVAKSATVDEKGIYLEAHVVDDAAWAKVKAGVYKGFSIGGKSIVKAGGVISKMRLSEISLVDRPANPECRIDLFKADDTELVEPAAQVSEEDVKKAAQVSAVESLADMLTAGTVDPVALLAFAKGAAPVAASATVLVVDEPSAVVAKVEGAAPVVEVAPEVLTKTAETLLAAAEPVAKGQGATVMPATLHAFQIANGDAPIPGAGEQVHAYQLAKGLGKPAEPAAVIAKTEPTPAVAAVAKADAAAILAATPLVPLAIDTTKGMGATAALAMLLKQLGYLVQDQNNEQRQEGDASTVPSLMHDLLEQGGHVLVAMATEESAELAANVDPNTAEDNRYVSSAPGNSANAGSNSMYYSDAVGNLRKAGARLSAATTKTVAQAHEHIKAASACLDSLGYTAPAPTGKPGAAAPGFPGDGKAAKAEQSEALAKLATERDEEIAKRLALEKTVDTISKQVAELAEKFAKSPTAPRGSLRVIGKGEDLSGTDAAPVAPTGPVLKRDGSIDQEATAMQAIRKVHAAGGAPLNMTRPF
jgi:phage head maturation protease